MWYTIAAKADLLRYIVEKGSITIDGISPVMRAKRVEFGETNRSQSEEIYFGGKGINVSVVLQRLGIASTALGFVAGFTGVALEQALSEQGVTTDFVRLQKGFTRINVKLKTDEETEINAKGPEISPEALEKLFTRLRTLQAGDTLVLAGSIPGSLPQDIKAGKRQLHQEAFQAPP